MSICSLGVRLGSDWTRRNENAQILNGQPQPVLLFRFDRYRGLYGEMCTSCNEEVNLAETLCILNEAYS